MSTTAFPVRQTTDGVGCTDVTMRKILGDMFDTIGPIKAISVKGANGTYYQVGSGTVVCSKGASDGKTLAYCEGGKVSVSANSASNPRIDVVWVTSHDVTQGDDDNLVTLGVTEGTAAATPTEPDIPSYATKIAAMQVPAGATTTSSATVYGSTGAATLASASKGLLLNLLVTHNGTWKNSGSSQGIANGTFTLSGKRTVQFNVTVTAGATNGKYVDGDASVYSIIKLNGSTHSSYEVRLRKVGNAVSSFYQVTAELEAGTYTLNWEYAINACDNIRMYYQKGSWAGQNLQVVDLGAAD